jgi:aldehyde:ferredoxin oxidoreductase
MERIFNLKAGITPAQDTLPTRLLENPLPSGASKGHVSLLPQMLPEYYELRGWSADGLPTSERLSELGLA